MRENYFKKTLKFLRLKGLGVLMLVVAFNLSYAQNSATRAHTHGPNSTGTLNWWSWNASNNYYTANVGGPISLSQITELYLHNFGFNIPSSAIILGIKVDVNKSKTATNTTTIQDSKMRIRIDSGAYSPSDYANTTAWPTTSTTSTYGGSSDLWGFSNITVAEINDPKFGIALVPKSGGLSVSLGGTAVYVEEPTITVYYYEPTAVNDASANGFVVPAGHICPDSQEVKVIISNMGINNINSMKINWTVNGSSRPQYSYSGTLVPTGSTGKSSDTVTIGKVLLSASTPVVVRAWTSMPNNSVDTSNANDTTSYEFTSTDFVVTAASDTVCSGKSVRLNLAPSTGYVTGDIQWQKSTDGTTFTNIANAISAVYTSPNNTVPSWFRVNIRGNNGCYSNTKKVEVTSPSVIAVVTDTICGSGKAQLGATGSSGTELLWYSAASGGTPLDTTNSFTTPTINANRTYYVAARDGACISGRSPVLAVVKPIPTVNLGGSVGFCEGNSITITTGTNDTNATYLWSDTSTADSLNISVAGTYYVTVTGGNGCTASDTVVVIEHLNPFVDLGADSTSFCTGESVMLLSGADTTNSILWNTGATTPDYEADSAGMYLITVTSSEGCVSEASIYVSEDLLPIVQSISGTNEEGCSFSFTASGVENADSYEWNFGDGSSGSIDENPTHTFAAAGTYTVTLIITNDCGSDTVTTGVECLPAGINKWDANQSLKVYPNPANQLLNVQYDGKTMMSQISIYNMVGQQVYQSSVNNAQYQLSVAQYASGIYQMRITLDNGEVLMKKFEVR